MNLNKIASIDIGGTNTRIAFFDKKDGNLNLIEKHVFPSFAESPEKTLQPVLEILLSKKIEYLAVCAPGVVNLDEGVILFATNLSGWESFNLKEYFFKRANISKIIFENDANAMAFAAHISHKKTNKDITQYLTISTGFGAGLIINNKIFHGFNFQAQEISFVPSASSKESNYLGESSAEAFLSGTGMNYWYKQKSGHALTTKEIFERYDQDKIAKNVIDNAIETLSRTITFIACWLNPSSLIIGGSVARNNWWFVEKAFEKAKKDTPPFQMDVLKLYEDKNGDDSALYGVLLFALQEFEVK